MSTKHDAFDAVYTALIGHFGPAPDEFEGLDPFEAMVSVVLHRALGGARWRSALDGLTEDRLLDPERLADAEILEIIDALREKGVTATARTVAPLKHLARWAGRHYRTGRLAVDCGATGEMPVPLGSLREELGAIKGIGPDGADAIILFALKRPSYPVDRASFRVLVRHAWLDPTATYDETRDLVVARAINDDRQPEEQAVMALRELSHGMERLGRQFCRAAAPRCGGCPLEHLLPEGGPLEVDA